MPDRYLELVNSGLGRTVAGRLGLPRPAMLRRYTPGDPLLAGDLLCGEIKAGLDGLPELLSAAGVRTASADDEGRRWAGLLFDATAARAPEDLAGLRAFCNGPLRRLRPSGRVVLLGRLPDGA